MSKSTALHRVLLAPPAIRSSFLPHTQRAIAPVFIRKYAVQSVTQTSFWVGLIPKPLQGSSPTAWLKKKREKKKKSKGWNPATFFINIFLLIGSMSIQMIALKNEFGAFSRRANAKIGLLKEIIEKIQNGEEVDVEGLLGTGDRTREEEWEEVLQEIEREDQAWENSQKRKPKHGRNLETPPSESATTESATTKMNMEPHEAKPRTNAPPGFY